MITSSLGASSPCSTESIVSDMNLGRLREQIMSDVGNRILRSAMSLFKSGIRIVRDEGVKAFLRKGLAHLFSQLPYACVMFCLFQIYIGCVRRVRASEKGCTSSSDYFDVIGKIQILSRKSMA
jgi:hypothetical protein